MAAGRSRVTVNFPRHKVMNIFELNRSVLDWLELVLKERFGVDFFLKRESTCLVSIRISDSNMQINVLCTLNGSSGVLDSGDVGFWNPQSEGWVSAIGSEIPAPGLQVVPGDLIKKEVNGYFIQYDIFNLMFAMLCRLEEYNAVDLDLHDRFDSGRSASTRNNYLDRPIVDEWLAVLRQVIERTWPNLELLCPHYCMQLSHDVDRPSRYGFIDYRKFLRAAGVDLMFNRNLSALAAPVIRAAVKSRLHPLDPYNTFDWLMTVSEDASLKSVFFFMTAVTDSVYDSSYEFGSPSIRALCREIYRRGHMIGLHPSYESYTAQNYIQSEFNTLKKICKEEAIFQNSWGARMHYLRYKFPDTIIGLSNAGISYDTSLGYADSPGFRCGTCFEFPVYEPLTEKTLSLRILPLIAMDASFLSKNYLNLGCSETAMEMIRKLIERCRSVNGTFTLLWHNSNLECEEKRAFYRSVVDFGSRV